jgi:hypothetical protein
MSNDALVDIKSSDVPGELAEAAAGNRKASDREEKKLEQDETPEKYRGKSIEDVIQMHQNAERKIGQTGNELGQYKQLTDQLLDLKRRDDLAKGGAEAEEEDEPLPKITQTEILDDPDTAIGKAIEARLNRVERKREQQAEATQAEQLQAEFAARHPDAQEIAQDPEFQAFVSKSKSRQMLVAAALHANNLFAANTILDEWKASRSQNSDESSEDENTDPNLEEARKASTLSTGASNTKDAPTGKVYNRLDLIRLKLEDPEAYGSEVFQQEIMKAYAEGRVR